MKRLDPGAVHDKLLLFSQEHGIKKVYFQPPSGFQLVYPCITYNLSRPFLSKASNKNYLTYSEYQITFITKDPDSTTPMELLEVMGPYMSHRGNSIQDGLYHHYFDYYEIY